MMPYQTHPDALAALAETGARLRRLWLPPPKMTVSEWAAANRVMPSGASSRPGPWRSDPYQVDIQDAVLDPTVREVVCMKSTQVGWSEMLNNVLGYHMDVRPMQMVLVQPSLDDAKGYSKKRIGPLIESVPALAGKVKRATSRRPGNTLLLKEFPGGFLKLTGANSGKGLRSDPAERVILDEADAYPEDVDGEGDPHEIIRRRMDAFPDAKLLMGGTPAKPKGVSKVEKMYQDSSRGEFHVPCPACGEFSPLHWRDPDGTYRLVFDRDEHGALIPDSVGYLCRACGVVWKEQEKWKVMPRGRWVHEYPRHPRRGFYLNALYSLAKECWCELVMEWLRAQDDVLALKSFVNLRLGEAFQEDGDSLDPDKVRLEPIERDVMPAAAKVKTCFVDVQKDRLEAQLMAWGAEEESWIIGWEVLAGEPAHPEVWADLDELLLRWAPDITLVDSGDVGHADPIYDFVQPRQRRRVYASKGIDHISGTGLAKEGSTRKARVRLWIIATHAAKQRVHARLAKPSAGPGKIHIPDWVTSEYVAQLASERLVRTVDKRTRRQKSEWIQLRTRNEAFDMTVGCLAGLFILQNFIAPHRYKNLAPDPPKPEPPPPPSEPRRPGPAPVPRPRWMGNRRAPW